MPCPNHACVRQFTFDEIAHYAHKRYVDGVATIELMSHAGSDHEKFLVVLATLMDLDDESIRGFKPYCNNECQQQMFELRERLRVMFGSLILAGRGSGAQGSEDTGGMQAA